MTKILFCGTAEFALPALEKLNEAKDFELVAVITQPDRPAGRGLELKASPVKAWLTEHARQIKILQPEKLRREAEVILEELKPDLIIVSAYGQFIPKVMLDYPRYGCLNIHGSLLPQLRGAVPMQMAILQGLTRTGVTIQIMTEKMDVGDVIAEAAIDLASDENAHTLMQKLSTLGADLLMETLPKWITGGITAQPQDESQATYCYQTDIAREKGQITAEMTVTYVERMIRAFNPNPVAWLELSRNGQTQIVKIFSAKIAGGNNNAPLTFRREGKRLLLSLVDGELELLQLQLSGKKIGNGSDYLFLTQ